MGWILVQPPARVSTAQDADSEQLFVKASSSRERIWAQIRAMFFLDSLLPPVRPGSVPDTWVTFYSDDIGFGPKGLQGVRACTFHQGSSFRFRAQRAQSAWRAVIHFMFDLF